MILINILLWILLGVVLALHGGYAMAEGTWRRGGRKILLDIVTIILIVYWLYLGTK